MGEADDLRAFLEFTPASAVPFAVLACGFVALPVGALLLGLPADRIALADGVLFASFGGAYCVRLRRRCRLWDMVGVSGLLCAAAVAFALGAPGALGL